MNTQRPFRFGVNMVLAESRRDWVRKCRRVEELGFDVLGVADHLGMPAPFPAMAVAAEATERVRLTTFVLNTPFYNPVLLAREVAGLDQLTDGRVELGLGAGYVKAEFEQAGIPFESGGRRVAHLERTATTLRRLFADPDHRPRPAQPAGPPLLIAGWGDRLLRVAAAHARIIGFTGAAAARDGGPLLLAGERQLGERVDFVRGALGERASEVELNLLIQRVAGDGAAATELFETYRPAMVAEAAVDPRSVPTLLAGSPEAAAERLHELRERFGISYFTVLEDSMEAFTPILARAR
ncbi:LLM class F420-dependent oxidoreductase [Nocardia farcinica]|uniref:LLM class F420-dependent oxidoreductase n=1 Tax=Nocardia farcinica TaxID=37329 RepID=UPI0018931256|nr:LLM class F420-dependent oxidoreductase [Nocardia farcinica]MBF6230707.1 LLM class F420-dependent oxidoreductase [Nocardia farcinica]